MKKTIASLAGLVVVASLGGQAAAVHADPAQHRNSSPAAKQAPRSAVQTNPFLSFFPGGTEVNYFAWKRKMAAAGEKRAASAQLAANRRVSAGVALPPAIVHDEEEPAVTSGSNDSAPNAEPVPGLSTAGPANHRVRILGDLADLAGSPEDLPTVAEDNGSIPLAGDTGTTGSGTIQTSGTLGDGPYGSAGDGTNDFDFYQLDAEAGLSIVADTGGSNLDTIIGLYAADGTLLAADDDSGGVGVGVESFLSYPVKESGTYYLAVVGYAFLSNPFPADPFDSGSGFGDAVEGDYNLTLGSQEMDKDFYSVNLRPGDVLGGSPRAAPAA
jgi:hypothetical protein